MTPDAIREWLIAFVEELLDVPAGQIDVLMSLDLLGVDSATTLVMAGELSDVLGVELSPVELVEHTTIEALTAHLSATSLAGV